MNQIPMVQHTKNVERHSSARQGDSLPKSLDEAPASMWPLGLEEEPPLGAHLTTSRRGYVHHGVYAGQGRVVHYAGISGFRQFGPVEEVSLSRFAVGRRVRILDHSGLPYSPEEIVRRARSRLGESDYRLLSNNCEHFCHWCISGVSRSAQVERRFTFLIWALSNLLRLRTRLSHRLLRRRATLDAPERVASLSLQS